MSFEKKYLQYKKKYLKLKKLVGGDFYLSDAYRIVNESFILGVSYEIKYNSIINAYNNLEGNDKNKFREFFRDKIFDCIMGQNEKTNGSKDEELYKHLNRTRRSLNIIDGELISSIKAYIEDHYWMNGLTNKVKNIIERSKIDLEQYFITPV